MNPQIKFTKKYLQNKLQKSLFPRRARIFLNLLLGMFLIFSATSVYAAATSSLDLARQVSNLYNWAIGAGAIVALGIIIYGGVLYSASAGNASRIGEAKTWIQSAIFGLILLFSSYLILFTINPDLVKLEDIFLEKNVPINPSGIELVAGTNDTGIEQCPAAGHNIPCVACENCVEIPKDVPRKECYPRGAMEPGKPCFLNKALLAEIQNIEIDGLRLTGWRITESWPPTVTHLSKCHQNGTCADLNENSQNQNPPTAVIKKYYDAFKAAGLYVLYENRDCTLYINAGVKNCATCSSMTWGSSFHVDADGTKPDGQSVCVDNSPTPSSPSTSTQLKLDQKIQ